ncbi:S1 family peptidase [Streptomyces sp. NPDC047046]|uniref:S1 family peptidase n=1 Tax=Streptomyces sp. NPDC047046 TaxID=3155378 RepID=UPI0033FAF9F4
MRTRRLAMLAGAILAVISFSPTARASVPPPGAAEVKELAAKLGPDRTAGVFESNGRVVLAVTDAAAADEVSRAGAVAQLVPQSTAELDSAAAALEALGGVPNTSWGVDPSSNQVVVEIHEGVPATDRARIQAVADEYAGAVQLVEAGGSLNVAAYEMRGGLGIVSVSHTCSAAFNVQNNSGKKFMLTAGHCIAGGNYKWSRRSGNIPLGTVTRFDYGDNNGADDAVVAYENSEVSPYGTIQYKNGSEGQITDSRYANDGEKVKRVGTMSQDLVGMVLVPSTTVTFSDGVTLHHMIKTSLCSVPGDSGGALFSGTDALGITSGGNYLDQPCADSDAQDDRVTYFYPVEMTLEDNGLKVY